MTEKILDELETETSRNELAQEEERIKAEFLCSLIPFPDKDLKGPLENPDVIVAALSYSDFRLLTSKSPSLPPVLYQYTLGGGYGMEVISEIEIRVSKEAVAQLRQAGYLNEETIRWRPFTSDSEYTLSQKGWERFKELQRQYEQPQEE